MVLQVQVVRMVVVVLQERMVLQEQVEVRGLMEVLVQVVVQVLRVQAG